MTSIKQVLSAKEVQHQLEMTLLALNGVVVQQIKAAYKSIGNKLIHKYANTTIAYNTAYLHYPQAKKHFFTFMIKNMSFQTLIFKIFCIHCSRLSIGLVISFISISFHMM